MKDGQIVDFYFCYVISFFIAIEEEKIIMKGMKGMKGKKRNYKKESQLKFEKMVTKRESKDEMFTFIHFINGLSSVVIILHAVVAVEGNGLSIIDTICVFTFFVSFHCIISSHTCIFKRNSKKVRSIVLQLATARVRVRETHHFFPISV